MDFSQYSSPNPLTDPEWIDRAISIMGDKFWDYLNNLYKLLDGITLGKSIAVEIWCKPENYEFFIKICHCYISEHETYRFENGYNKITHKYSEKEIVDFKNTILRLKQKRNEHKQTTLD